MPLAIFVIQVLLLLFIHHFHCPFLRFCYVINDLHVSHVVVFINSIIFSQTGVNFRKLSNFEGYVIPQNRKKISLLPQYRTLKLKEHAHSVLWFRMHVPVPCLPLATRKL